MCIYPKMNPVQVKMARAALGWSIRRLAEETGLSPNTIINFEEGKPSVQPKTVDRIFTRLGLAGCTFFNDPVNGVGIFVRKID